MLEIGKAYTICFTSEKDSFLLKLEVPRYETLKLQTRGAAVRVTVTRENGAVLRSIQPDREEQEWLPLEEEITLEAGVYLLSAETMIRNTEDECVLLLKKAEKATAEETEDPAGPEEEPEKEPGKTSEEEPEKPEDAPEEITEEPTEPEEKPEGVSEEKTEEPAEPGEEQQENPEEEPAEAPTEEPEEEPAEEPAEEPGEKPVEDPEEQREENPEPAEEPVPVIRIVAATEKTEKGTEITLTAVIEPYDPETMLIQWQYSADGGRTAEDLQGENGLSYSFIRDDDNADLQWRVSVTRIPRQPEETEEP